MKHFVMQRFNRLSVVVLAIMTASLLMPTLPITDDVNASGGKSQTYAQEIVLKPNSSGTKAIGVVHGTTRLWKDKYISEDDYYYFKTSSYRGSTHYITVTHDGGTARDIEADLWLEGKSQSIVGRCIPPYSTSQINGYDDRPRNTIHYICVGMWLDGDKEQADYTINITEKIRKPQKQILSSVKAGKKKISLKYTRDGYSERYQVAYKIQKGKKWIYKTTKNSSYVIKKLKAKKKYKVKVRGQRKCYGKWVSGNWSKTKTVKVR